MKADIYEMEKRNAPFPGNTHFEAKNSEREKARPLIMPYFGRNYFYCSKCRHRVMKKDKYCRECGVKLRWSN